MSISAFEGIVQNGAIRLRGDVRLPENTRVLVVIPDFESGPRAHVLSPRLVHPEQASDFAKEVIEVAPDAKL